jgi:hypothetical protein
MADNAAGATSSSPGSPPAAAVSSSPTSPAAGSLSGGVPVPLALAPVDANDVEAERARWAAKAVQMQIQLGEEHAVELSEKDFVKLQKLLASTGVGTPRMGGGGGTQALAAKKAADDSPDQLLFKFMKEHELTPLSVPFQKKARTDAAGIGRCDCAVLFVGFCCCCSRAPVAIGTARLVFAAAVF